MRGTLLVAVLLAGCGAGFQKGVVPAPSTLSTTVEVADTARVRVGCRVPANTTCRWAVTVGGAAVAGLADGLTADLAFVAPAPGDSVEVVASARAVRRGLVSTAAATKRVWVSRPDVAPAAPDSVFVITVTVPPVSN